MVGVCSGVFKKLCVRSVLIDYRVLDTIGGRVHGLVFTFPSGSARWKNYVWCFFKTELDRAEIEGFTPLDYRYTAALRLEREVAILKTVANLIRVLFY